jgi:hypothetical protein
LFASLHIIVVCDVRSEKQAQKKTTEYARREKNEKREIEGKKEGKTHFMKIKSSVH